MKVRLGVKSHIRIFRRIFIYLDFKTPTTLATYMVYEEIDGIKTYFATPKVEYLNDKAITYLTDIWVI